MTPEDALALVALISLAISAVTAGVRGVRHAVAVERRYTQHLKETRP